MKMDMGGAATVLGIMHAIGKLQPKVKVTGIFATCENLVDAKSYKPGDVITMYNGKTVEITNTDAEGRMLLADCLTYASKLKPEARLVGINSPKTIQLRAVHGIKTKAPTIDIINI